MAINIIFYSSVDASSVRRIMGLVTFSVIVTLLLLRVEKPEEQSVSADGELGQDLISPWPSSPPSPAGRPMLDIRRQAPPSEDMVSATSPDRDFLADLLLAFKATGDRILSQSEASQPPLIPWNGNK